MLEKIWSRHIFWKDLVEMLHGKVGEEVFIWKKKYEKFWFAVCNLVTYQSVNSFLVTFISTIKDFSKVWTFVRLADILKDVDNKAKGRISKQVLQENKAHQIFRKTNISSSLIRTPTYAYQGVRNARFVENLASFIFL